MKKITIDIDDNLNDILIPQGTGLERYMEDIFLTAANFIHNYDGSIALKYSLIGESNHKGMILINNKIIYFPPPSFNNAHTDIFNSLIADITGIYKNASKLKEIDFFDDNLETSTDYESYISTNLSLFFDAI